MLAVGRYAPGPSGMPGTSLSRQARAEGRGQPVLAPQPGCAVDRLTAEERSRLMSRIRGKDTKPEMAVRRLVHGMGFRYRLHRRDLPGSPDLVLPRHRKVILVHGCFWHSHPGCRAGRVPASNTGYWEPKLRRNAERDAASEEALRLAGWAVLVVWECQTRKAADLGDKLGAFLNGAAP